MHVNIGKTYERLKYEYIKKLDSLSNYAAGFPPLYLEGIPKEAPVLPRHSPVETLEGFHGDYLIRS